MFILGQRVHTEIKSEIASCADEIKPFYHTQILGIFSFDSKLRRFPKAVNAKLTNAVIYLTLIGIFLVIG